MKRFVFVGTALFALVALFWAGCSTTASKGSGIPQIDTIGWDDIVKADICGLFDPPIGEDAYNQMTRYMRTDDKIKLYRILSYEEAKNRALQFLRQEYKIKGTNVSETPVVLTDFYAKIEEDDKSYHARWYISYEKTPTASGGSYPAKSEGTAGSNGAGIPSEADRGGLNVSFVKYDYVRQYKFGRCYTKYADFREATIGTE